MINYDLAHKANELRIMAHDMKRRIRVYKDLQLRYETFPELNINGKFTKSLPFAEAGLKRIEAYYYRVIEEILKDRNI